MQHAGETAACIAISLLTRLLRFLALPAMAPANFSDGARNGAYEPDVELDAGSVAVLGARTGRGFPAAGGRVTARAVRAFRHFPPTSLLLLIQQ